MVGVRKYSDDELLARLKVLADKLGRAPSRLDDPNLFFLCAKRFGSWNNAKRLVGLQVYEWGRGQRKYSDEDVLRRLKDLGAKLGRSPKASDDMGLFSLCRIRFGSWNRAKELAGLKLYRIRGKDTEKKIYDAIDKPMLAQDIAKKLSMSETVINKCLLSLYRKGGVNRIRLISCRAGSRVKYGSTTLFNGLASRHIYWKTGQERELVEMIKRAAPNGLINNPGMKRAMTLRLRSILPKAVFEEVWKSYSKVKKYPKLVCPVCLVPMRKLKDFEMWICGRCNGYFFT